MSNPIVVGPLLGFESAAGQEFYTVCVLLEPGPIPQLHLHGQMHPFVQSAEVGVNRFWRTEFPCPAQPTGVELTYSIVADGTDLADRHGRTRWTFHLPGAGERPLIAYASCNGFSSAKLARDTDQPCLLWERMAATHFGLAQPGTGEPPPPRPFSLLLMGGDQVYADELWHSKFCPLLQKWNELSWKQQNDPAVPVAPAMAAEIAGFYNWLYVDRWSDPTMSLMLASVPSLMMWDDHDIFDGWGSYPPERQACPVFRKVFDEASRVFDVFQLRCSPRNRLAPAGPHRSLAVQFREHHILVLDNRTDRSPEQVMSKGHWDAVKQWLAEPGTLRATNLLVMTGVPVVYRSFAAVEGIIDTTPWHEEVEDDVHDHWSARSHLAERMKLVMVLMKFLEQRGAGNCKAVLLSGDVHVGALGQLWNDRKQLRITQVVASGIVHPCPTVFQWAGIQLMTSDTPEALGNGEVTAEMLTPLGAPRYLRTRNYATLQTGSDHNLWVNWVCENEKLRPSFAIGN